ncbi:MAG: MerR family transcriptional regulator [Clostridia bacterium]|nr:MerR family transcriptional regulator [Clostridia bacterium]
MMTVREVSALTGVSVRALHHYDSIGLLPPTAVSEAGYRLYDEEALVRLQCIMLYRTLEFPLRDIKAILDSEHFERNRALDQQIALLELKREHIDNLIRLAKGVRAFGLDMKNMQFEAFDTTKIEQYAAEARASWGDTEAWREYEGKREGRSPERERQLGEGMMALMAEFGALRGGDPASEAARELVEKLRGYITEHYYTCTDEILRGLAAMYAGGGSMTENIDAAGGPGTGTFIAAAIRACCPS